MGMQLSGLSCNHRCQLTPDRYLGEQPIGHMVARLNPRTSFLEAAPIHVVVEPASLGKVTDDHLAHWAKNRRMTL